MSLSFLFQSLNLFTHHFLDLYVTSMRDTLNREPDPNNETIDNALPGVNRRFDVLEDKIDKSTNNSKKAIAEIAAAVAESASSTRTI